MTQGTAQQGLLEGYRVLDLADEKGIYCTKLLADLGADVTIVEPNNPPWVAIHAIELAGTGTDLTTKIAEATCSGKLEWELPLGHSHVTWDGEPGFGYHMVQVQEGKFVLLPMP